MAFLKKINKKAKTDSNTGFGTNATSYGGRFITKNGNANVKKTGIGFFDSISWYHTMVNIPRWKFMLIIVLFYFVVNFCFASLYYMIGVEHLKGIIATKPLDKFGQAFFFSIQTYTTVGYGHISPSGFLTSFLAAVEALFGLLSFAIATGLFYGRFSMPKAFLMFSQNALIAPFGSGTALMIRLSPYKNTNLTDAEAKMTLGMTVEENGKLINKFYNLDLELAKINALTLSWTLVHPITENSPFYNLTEEDYRNTNGEILVYLKVFDDMFSTTVVKRTSYSFKEIIFGAKFLPMFSRSNDDNRTLLHLDKLDLYEKVIL
ncbi:Inward rectifier potassium channel Irk [Flavobacterium sp. J49]|uniref:ion channel n=1 Tax=Flavobacterium sp. J49 TaxID=2718534 RepID=UPI00159341FE|nr:ion channel [Flavobacterium sp. J49]MBF6642295.1 Inward rectifier potassium channel Irk [Flavobacterium sp. J49]NIC03541.1 Inward rectifier potassium channel Irk [Flavobacterium sp. J49]